jgi:hypothetical protein
MGGKFEVWFSLEFSEVIQKDSEYKYKEEKK